MQREAHQPMAWAGGGTAVSGWQLQGREKMMLEEEITGEERCLSCACGIVCLFMMERLSKVFLG